MKTKIGVKHYVALFSLFGATKLIHGISQPALSRMGPISKIGAYATIFSVSSYVADLTMNEILRFARIIQSNIEHDVKEVKEDV